MISPRNTVTFMNNIYFTLGCCYVKIGVFGSCHLVLLSPMLRHISLPDHDPKPLTSLMFYYQITAEECQKHEAAVRTVGNTMASFSPHLCAMSLRTNTHRPQATWDTWALGHLGAMGPICLGRKALFWAYRRIWMKLLMFVLRMRGKRE